MFEENERFYNKKKNKKVKKSDHKHDYEIIDIESRWNWFNKKKVCKICQREGGRFKDN
jgi:hypothetical protein